ncbi:MAG: DMT family transporter [Prolixibacteraceae bacterium]|jgi:drug/metabolite transporter (DMT)-like permease|nr:DMT family transporter [Prolixibacteraceae bacterium]
MPKNRKAGHLIMFAVTLIFGINIPLSKSLLPQWISPEGLTLSRIIFGAAIFWIASLFVPHEKVTFKEHRFFLIGSLVGVVFNQGLFISGLNMTSPIDASIIITCGPLFAMIFAAFLLKEPISLLKVLGVLVGASGAILLVYTGHHASTAHTSNLTGNLMVFGSAVIYAFYLVFTKPLTLRYSPTTMMKWMFLYASIFVAPFYYRQVLSAPVFSHPEPTALLQMAYTLTFATFLAYLLIPMAQQRIRPTTISMYNNFQPLVASIVAVSVGMDHFSIIKGLSAVLIFAGVYLVTRSKARAENEKGVLDEWEAPESYK